MKVISKGKEITKWSKEFTCTGGGNMQIGCGAILLIEEEDVFITTTANQQNKFNTFQCCECGAKTDIYENLPFVVSRTLNPFTGEIK